jgi:hypothetical protein
MTLPDKTEVERVRAYYPAGTRVEITRLKDPYSTLKPGDRGTVEFVDDTASVHCVFDDGSHLGLLYAVDGYRKLTVISDEVVAAVRKIQLSGETNMFDVRAVFKIAIRDDYYALADFIFMNTRAYSRLILTGETEF